MRDEGGRKVCKREIVARFHLPTDQQRAKAIVPAVRALHDPTPWLAAHAPEEGRLTLLSDVRDDAAIAHGAVAVPKRIPFVEAAVLRAAHATSRLQHDRVERARQRPFIVQIRAT